MEVNALIAGSTGLVGNELLKLLVHSGLYSSIHLPVRRDLISAHQHIHYHKVDLLKLDKFNPGVSIRDLYICLGTTHKKAGGKAGFYQVDHDMVMHLAHWAKNQHAERVCIISSIGANPAGNSFYLQTKGRVERELINLDFSHLCILRPSLLLGKREERRWAEDIAARVYPALAFLLTGKLRKYRAVKAEKVAEAMFYFTTNMTEKLLIIESDRINA